LKINFEKESYPAKADIALAQLIVPEEEFVEKIYRGMGLSISSIHKRKIAQRGKRNKKKNQKKSEEEYKRKRAERRNRSYTKAGIDEFHFYGAPQPPKPCGCKSIVLNLIVGFFR